MNRSELSICALDVVPALDLHLALRARSCVATTTRLSALGRRD